MRKAALILLHNLLMVFFVILIVFNQSFQNQVLISTIALAYWVLGLVFIYKKRSTNSN